MYEIIIELDEIKIIKDGFIMALLNTPWFMNNVRKWEYWKRDKNHFEDVIENCKRKGVM